MPPTVIDATTAARRLADTLPAWRVADGSLRRTWETDGWRTTLMVVNAIAWVCETADHHPDLAVHWGRVEVALNTHSAGGITELDLAVAARLEEVVTWRPPAGGPLRGPAKPLVG